MGNCAGIFLSNHEEREVNPMEYDTNIENSKSLNLSKSLNFGKSKGSVPRSNVAHNKLNESEIEKIIKIQAFAKGLISRKQLNEGGSKLKNQRGLLNFFEKQGSVAERSKIQSSIMKIKKNDDSAEENNFETFEKRLTKSKAVIKDFIKFNEESESNQTRREKEKQIEENKWYEGDWVGTRRTGQGRLKWGDGSIYTGKFLNNKAQGFGKLIHPDGDLYIGNWYDDKAHGIGKYINTKDSSYQGFWVADKQEGYGVEIWTNGSIFEGYFKNGNKSGVGILKFEDNACYRGEFSKNDINGIGTCVFKDHRKYEGEWKDNKMNGFGIITWPNGKSFQGSFVNDKKEGFGIYYSKNKVYICNWKNSKMHGEVIIVERGLVRRSLWDEGKKLKNYTEDKLLINEKYIFELINNLL